MKEILDELSPLAIAILFLTVMLIVSVTMIYAVYPTWLGLEREAIEQSNQYHQSRLAELRTYYESYLENEVKLAETDNEALKETLINQNTASLREIYRIVDELGDNVPDYIKPFLNQHPYPTQ